MSLTKASFAMISGSAVSVADYIPAGTTTSTTDCSTYFTDALAALIAAGGGTLWIPFATYKVNLDWSAQVISQDYSGITILGNNSLLLGVTGAQAVLTVDRGGTGDNWLDSKMKFYDLEFRTESNVCNGGTPVIYHAAKFVRSTAKFYSCTFAGGSHSAFYGYNYQYGIFVDCTFACSTVVPTDGLTSAGCWIQSKYTETAADQMTFDRCSFTSNQNGLYIQGCQQLRVLNSRAQGNFANGEGGIVIKDYIDSIGSEDILISSCHFESNAVRDILMPNQTSRSLIQSCVFSNQIGYVGTFVATVQITSTNCSFLSNDFRTASGPTITLAGDNAQLLYIGNDKDPYSVTPTGSNPQYINQKTTSGTIDFAYAKLLVSAYWAAPGLNMGTYTLWVDSFGRLRIKNGAPTSDTDGVVVGTQT